MATRQIVKAVLSAVTIVSVTALASAQAANAEQDQWLTQQMSMTDGAAPLSRPATADQGVAGRARALVASKEGKPGDASAARNMEQVRKLSEQLSVTDGSAR